MSKLGGGLKIEGNPNLKNKKEVAEFKKKHASKWRDFENDEILSPSGVAYFAPNIFYTNNRYCLIWIETNEDNIEDRSSVKLKDGRSSIFWIKKIAEDGEERVIPLAWKTEKVFAGLSGLLKVYRPLLTGENLYIPFRVDRPGDGNDREMEALSNLYLGKWTVEGTFVDVKIISKNVKTNCETEAGSTFVMCGRNICRFSTCGSDLHIQEIDSALTTKRNTTIKTDSLTGHCEFENEFGNTVFGFSDEVGNHYSSDCYPYDKRCKNAYWMGDTWIRNETTTIETYLAAAVKFGTVVIEGTHPIVEDKGENERGDLRVEAEVTDEKKRVGEKSRGVEGCEVIGELTRYNGRTIEKKREICASTFDVRWDATGMFYVMTQEGGELKIPLEIGKELPVFVLDCLSVEDSAQKRAVWGGKDTIGLTWRHGDALKYELMERTKNIDCRVSIGDLDRNLYGAVCSQDE